MVTRITAVVAACCLVAAPLVVKATAQAAVPAATVPAACVDSVSSLTVQVNEVVSFGPTPPGCTVVSNSSEGNLDRVSSSGFVAFAAGSGAVFQLMTNGTTQFLIKVNVTIVEPAPTPTPTPTGTATPTPTGTAGPAPTGTTVPTASASPSAQPTDPPVLAQPDRPLDSQRLTARDITVTPGLKPDQVAFFGPDGTPLQLLSMSGDTDAITVIDDGTNYATRPANWQRLGYGDLCWTYAGYAGTQGFVLPVANPPFGTVPANWVLTAAIVGTATGNVIYLEPVPGQVVRAGGRDAATLTLCAKGFPNAAAASDAARSLRAVPADKGGGQYSSVPGCTNGQATGNKHCVGQPTFPTYTTNLGPTSTATARPSPAATPTPTPTPVTSTAPTSTPTPTPTATPTPKPTSSSSPTATATQTPADEPVLPVCRATGDPANPYRRELVRTSQIVPTGGDRLFPTLGWTDILPPTKQYPAGQNWLPGAATLFDAECRITFVKPEPVQTVSGMSPGPTASPGPEITGFSPVVIVEPVPQPSFTAYGPVNPWPPLQPVPLTGSGTALVPTATPTPLPSLTPTPLPPSPTATPPSPIATPPSPSPSPTLTPSPAPPTPIATPPSPSPLATPPPPTGTATPIAKPSFTGFGPVCGTSPCLLTPVLPPSIPYTTLIDLSGGPGATPSPTATPTASPTATPTPRPTASPTASPTATPTATPTASPTASPTATPTASATTAPAAGRVTFVLTNGPSTVAFTVSTGSLVKVAAPTPLTTTPTRPPKPSSVAAGRSRLSVLAGF